MKISHSSHNPAGSLSDLRRLQLAKPIEMRLCCPRCGSANVQHTRYNHGEDWDTGYIDEGVLFRCACGATGEEIDLRLQVAA